MYALTSFGILFALVCCANCLTKAKPSKLALANNNFALALYKSISDEIPGKNMIFSSTSISTALAMLYVGAVNNTKTEMAAALHFNEIESGDNGQELKTLYENFLKSLKEQKNDYTLTMANALFGAKQFEIKPEYLRDIQDHFLGAMEKLDFAKDSAGSQKHINDWVEEHTNKKIVDLLPPGALTKDTSLVIVNAIHFKATWLHQFRKENTKPEPFRITKTQQSNVEMMEYKQQGWQYFKDDDLHCQILELPYVGGTASMYVLLPEDAEGLSALEKQLTITKLDMSIDRLAYKKITTLKLPKFLMKQDIALKQFLQKLGMKDVFDGRAADLSTIFGSKGQAVTEVMHKAYISVNEEGTEAAAATAVNMAGSSLDPVEVNFIADHPFIFLIVETRSRSILFLGRFTKPSTEGERIGTFAAQYGSTASVLVSTVWLAITCLVSGLLLR